MKEVDPKIESLLELLARMIVKGVETRGLLQSAGSGNSSAAKKKGPMLVVKIVGSKGSCGGRIMSRVVAVERELPVEELSSKGVIQS